MTKLQKAGLSSHELLTLFHALRQYQSDIKAQAKVPDILNGSWGMVKRSWWSMTKLPCAS